MVILGVETSCDETAISLVEFPTLKKNKVGSPADSVGPALNVLSSIVSSQTKIHSKWGGVVPNLAAREHLKNIFPVLSSALRKAKKSPKDIDLITVTQGPGLIPALLIGTNAAKALSYIWNKPLLGIHHIEGHIYANFIGDKISAISNSKFLISKPNEAKKLKAKSSNIRFPILCLVVSGGHTQLVLMKKHLNYEILGQTLDDAAGEAFDKVARILNLGFPGGPAVAAAAAKIKNEKTEITLPRPMMNKGNFDFSFSGLKTAVLYKTKKLKTINYKLKTSLAQEFQQAVVDVLVSKTIKAAKKYNPKTIMLAGGVSANKELRKQMEKAVKDNCPNSLFIIPDSKYCVDNATMIAAAGFYRWRSMNATQKKKAMNNWKTIQADSNLKLK